PTRTLGRWGPGAPQGPRGRRHRQRLGNTASATPPPWALRLYQLYDETGQITRTKIGLATMGYNVNDRVPSHLTRRQQPSFRGNQMARAVANAPSRPGVRRTTWRRGSRDR